ncbi:MAG TPA: HdeD family acid-resistance protein [Steroidobacteraceae bacterium]|nr:HdeD family acid-resistance protein [Steroidobacteraceae bacterium]
MSSVPHRPIDFVGELHRSWGWFLALGIAFIVCGAFCIVSNIATTFATVLFFGWLLLISGIAALVHAFTAGSWRGSLLYLLSALLRGFTGYLLVRYPAAGAMSLTLVLASFFVVGGSFRAIGAGMIQFPRWGWSVFSGVLSVVLGVMLLVQLPASSVWFIGFAIGIDLIFEGASLVGFAAAVHELPGPSAHQPA